MSRAHNFSFHIVCYQTTVFHLLAKIHGKPLRLSNDSVASVKSEGCSVLVLAYFRTAQITYICIFNTQDV